MSNLNNLKKGNRVVVKCGNGSHGYVIEGTVFSESNSMAGKMYKVIAGNEVLNAVIPVNEQRHELEEPNFLYSTVAMPFMYHNPELEKELIEFSKQNPHSILVNVDTNRSDSELVRLAHKLSK